MKRRNFIEALSFLPFVGGFDLDDNSIFSHWHEELSGNEEQSKPGEGIVVKNITTGNYLVGRWTPYGSLQFKEI